MAEAKISPAAMIEALMVGLCLVAAELDDESAEAISDHLRRGEDRLAQNPNAAPDYAHAYGYLRRRMAQVRISVQAGERGPLGDDRPA